MNAIEYGPGLLHSWLMQWRFKSTSTDNNVGTNELGALPIASSDETQHGRVVSLVDQMLAAEQQETAASGHAREVATRECAAIDRQTDALVYQRHGLTDGEIALVEGTA